MAGEVVLDTNIVTRLIEKDDEVKAKAATIDDILVPSIVVGELFYGAHHSTRVEANLDRVQRFVAGVIVLDSTISTADHYGRIKHELRVKGRPIPDNDIWIATLCRQHDAAIATRDTHFDQVDGIKVLRW